jgi:hypothetical protein
LEDNTGAIFLIKNQQVGGALKHIDAAAPDQVEKRDNGEPDVISQSREQRGQTF